jgi:hypothetical protein
MPCPGADAVRSSRPYAMVDSNEQENGKSFPETP